MKTFPQHLFAFALTLSALIIAQPSADAQTPAYQIKDQPLYDAIAHMDAVCFDAFNKQDLETLKTIFSKDVEFYNDGGSVTGYEPTMKKFEEMFYRNKTSGLRRELVKDSLEVYPLDDFGAIEAGVHRFIHTENGKEEIGILKFLSIWKLTDGKWQMTRVISYNH